MSPPKATPFLSSEPLLHERALGAGTYSNTASTVTYSDLFPTGAASTSTASDGSVATTSAAASSSNSSGGTGSPTLYLIIFLSILSILLIASTLIAIRAIALRRRYRTEIQRALARGELPPFQTAYTDPHSGQTTLPASYGLPRWTAFLFGYSGDMPGGHAAGQGDYDDRGRRGGRNASDLYGFGMGGVGDHFRGFQTGGMATERERQRRERKYMELPVMWEFELETEGGGKVRRDSVEKGVQEWVEDAGMPFDLARVIPISLAALDNTVETVQTPTNDASYPPQPRPRSQSSTSNAPPLFTLSPLTESISRTLTRYTTNGSEVTTDGPMTANEVLTGRRRSSSAATRDRADWIGMNRDGGSYPEVVHEVANEDASRGPSRNPSRRPSLVMDGRGNVAGIGAGGGPGVVNNGEQGQVRRNDGAPALDGFDSMRSTRNPASRTRNGRGGYGNTMSTRSPPNAPYPHSNRVQGSAYRSRTTGELPTAVPLTRAPVVGEDVRVGFLIRMPEREDMGRSPRTWDEEDTEPGHALMELGVLDGTVGWESSAMGETSGRAGPSRGHNLEV